MSLSFLVSIDFISDQWIDHMLVTGNVEKVISSVSLIRTPFCQNLSDHYPFKLTLAKPSQSPSPSPQPSPFPSPEPSPQPPIPISTWNVHVTVDVNSTCAQIKEYELFFM